MKTYTTKNIRNVVLIGAPRSGKTTLSEAMLFEGKVIDRRGTVEDKNTVSDNTEFEQTNQKSINATPLYAEFGGCKINFIDAPVPTISRAAPCLPSRWLMPPSW